MIERLEQLAVEVTALNSKLILIVGPPHSGKTALLAAFGKRLGVEPLNIGSELGRRLTAIPQKKRHLQVVNIMHELVNQHVCGDLLLVDNIELLFDRSLQLNPLDLLKRHATAKRDVAVWPGELRQIGNERRLTYADMGHPEHQDYGTEGLVTFEI